MSRKTLSLWSALLAAAPLAARADLPLTVHLYGFLDVEAEWARALGGATPYTSRMRLADGNSVIGLKGSYQLGEDTEAAVQLEGFLNNFEQGGVNDLGQSATLESRNSYLSVRDQRFGSLLLGNVDNAYRSLVGTGSGFGGNRFLTEVGLDLWNNTSAAVSGGFSSLFGRGEARLPNSLHYRSPALFGAQLSASYGFDETEAQGGRRDHLSLGVLYAPDFLPLLRGLRLGLGFDHQANTGVDTDALLKGQGMQMGAANDVATNFYKAIVSYSFAPTGSYLGVGYERSVYGYADFAPPNYATVTTPLAYGTMSQGGFLISAAQAIGDVTVMASFGKLGKLSGSIVGSGADYQATQLSLGAKYAINASFMVYVYFTRIDNDPMQSLNLGAPIFSNNLGQSTAYLAPGDKPMAGGTGLLARF